MQKSLYVVYDSVAEQVAGPVISCSNDMVARRMFQDALLSEGSIIASHPGDYVLLKIGTLDESVPHLEACTREVMITGQQVVDLQARFDKRMDGANDGRSLAEVMDPVSQHQRINDGS